MVVTQSEAYSRVRIDKALEASGWDLQNSHQVGYEVKTTSGRADYLLRDDLGRVTCVLEAKSEDKDPYDAKEQARGYAENLNAPFIILSNGTEHWFWNYQQHEQGDAYRIERMPSQDDLRRMRLRNLNPARALGTELIKRDYLEPVMPGMTLRGYQVDALDAIAEGFDSENRRKFLLEMATGTGKTLLCAAMIRRFLKTRNAERVLFIVDRIELARQTMEDFQQVLGEYSPVIYKTARRTGELNGSSVVVATIQSLMMNSRYRDEFTPFYFDLVVNDEAHRGIYGDAREAVQFFQATRIGLTATPKAYLRNIDAAKLAAEDPKAFEMRQLRDTYHYFGCEPGEPTYRYDLIEAVQDPEGPYLCLPTIIDCRSDITTQALSQAGWTVTINEQDENYKVSDLERKVFTPERNRVMCQTFLDQAQRDPSGKIGKSLIFAVNQRHATELTKMLNEIQPDLAVTITSRVKDASAIAKDFRDGKRNERVAVSVDMLSTGYNCKDLLNIVLMRPVFSPTEYIQIKGRGTRLYTFHHDGKVYEKERFFLIDFCAVAEYFEEEYDYAAPLSIPRPKGEPKPKPSPPPLPPPDPGVKEGHEEYDKDVGKGKPPIPVWEGTDVMLTKEIRIVGPDGEKVDVMTFRGSFERDIKKFAEDNLDLQQAIHEEDDDAIDTILQERFYHRPDLYYSPDKLVVSYGVPANTSAFVYNAVGKRKLPTKQEVIEETVESLAAQYNLRTREQKLIQAIAGAISENRESLDALENEQFDYLLRGGVFRRLDAPKVIAGMPERKNIFQSLLSSSLVEATRQAFRIGS